MLKFNIKKIPMKKITIVLIVILACCFSCKKNSDTTNKNNGNIFGTTVVDSNQYLAINVSTTVNNLPSDAVIQHGHCWGTTANPDITGLHSSLGTLNVAGKFSSSITGLTSNTVYYIRPYLTEANATIYGEQRIDTTLRFGKPVITTGDVTNIKATSASVGGVIVSNGGDNIIKRGVCWNITGNPGLGNCLGSTDNGTGTGSFTASITGLTANTIYYVVAYASNSIQTGYGEIKQFTTHQAVVPTVTTGTVTNITVSSATCGGNVTSSGNATVTVRGLCWNTTGNPSLGNETGFTSNGSGTGNFSTSITGLSGNTVYYVAAYATNEMGTGYGQIVQFTTPLPCGQLVVSYGGENYPTVQIGTQCWFRKNLNIGTQITGTHYQSDNGVVEKFCYNDDVNYCNTYGGLYSWDELMNYSTHDSAQGICPAGWHVPSDVDWQKIADFLVNADNAGAHMKETGTLHWSSTDQYTDNSSGFTGLPGGEWLSPNEYEWIRDFGFFWSSTQLNYTFGHKEQLSATSGVLYQTFDTKSVGYSERCIQNWSLSKSK